MGVSEPAGGDAELAALREELLRRDAAFERDRGEKSSRAHIAADAEWEALYQSLKRAEKALAEASRVSGQCAQYIARRRRFCASRAADGCDGYCSLHSAGLGEALSRPAAGPKDDADASERDAAAADETDPSRKKTNVHRRMKKLTNPMALHHRTAAAAPTWSEVYDDLDRPLLIDVGCAKGRFLMRAANADAARFEASLSLARTPAKARHNLLGLEIYAPIVEEALRWTAQTRDDARPRNLHFVACNANVTLTRAWLGDALADRTACVTILFPDPWSRARHAPRRVVTPEFVRALAELCRGGTRVYCCSDVEPLAEEMQATFLSGARVDGESPFVLDEASYVAHGEATAAELKRNAAERVSSRRPESPAGLPARRPAFDHVFPAHPYAWQGALGDGERDANAATSRDAIGGGSGSGSAPGPNGASEKSARAAAADADAADADAADADADAERNERRRTERTRPAAAPPRARWLAANPMGVPTERDLVCESKWRPVYRFVVVRRAA